jgi:hypothetical protein
VQGCSKAMKIGTITVIIVAIVVTISLCAKYFVPKPTPPSAPTPSSETPSSETPSSQPTKEMTPCRSPENCRYPFEKMLHQIEDELRLFRDETVRVHTLSCNDKMTDCSKNNYNDCDSVYPDGDMQCVPQNLTLSDENQTFTCNGESQLQSQVYLSR